MANKKTKSVPKVCESVYERIGRGYYTTTSVPYPNKKDFYIEEEVATKFLGTQTLKGFDKAGFDAALKAYREDNVRLADEFKADALEEVGLTGHPKADKCFNLAEEHGHSNGYADVMCYLVDFADLVK